MCDRLSVSSDVHSTLGSAEIISVPLLNEEFVECGDCVHVVDRNEAELEHGSATTDAPSSKPQPSPLPLHLYIDYRESEASSHAFHFNAYISKLP